VTEYWS